MDRESQKRWDHANMATITCRVTKKKAEEFKKACADLGTSKSAVIQIAINQTIEEANKKSGK